jgi:hypothetical protein
MMPALFSTAFVAVVLVAAAEPGLFDKEAGKFAKTQVRPNSKEGLNAR